MKLMQIGIRVELKLTLKMIRHYEKEWWDDKYINRSGRKTAA